MCIGLSDVEVEKQGAEHMSLRNTCTQSRGITLRKIIPNHILTYMYMCIILKDVTRVRLRRCSALVPHEHGSSYTATLDTEPSAASNVLAGVTSLKLLCLLFRACLPPPFQRIHSQPGSPSSYDHPSPAPFSVFSNPDTVKLSNKQGRDLLAAVVSL